MQGSSGAEPVPRCLPTAEGSVGPLFLRIPSRAGIVRQPRAPRSEPSEPSPPVPEGCAGKRGMGGLQRASGSLFISRFGGGEEGPVLAALRPLGCSCAVSEQSPSVGSAGAQVTPGNGPRVSRRRGGNSFPLSSMGPGIAASDSHRAAVNS